MASTYELYQGGPRQQNSDFAMFPAATFSSSNVAALAPANKTPVIFGVERTLDFTNDTALAYWYNNTLGSSKFVTNDTVGTVVIPSQSTLLGVWWSINNAVTGGVISLIVRGATITLLSGQSTSAATSGRTVANLTAGGEYFADPDIVDVKFTTVPGGGLQALSLTVVPVYYNFQVGAN